MTRWWEDPEWKAEVVARMQETRARLGPRLGHPTESVHRPGDFYGSAVPRRRSTSGGKAHPTHDAA